MNQRLLCMAVLLVMLCLAAGCMPKSGGGSGGSSGETLGQQVARHDLQLQQLLSQVGQVEQVLPGQAEMWSQMQTMRQELNVMQGRVEDLSLQVSGEGTGELAVLKDRVARMEGILRQVASQMGISLEALDAAPTATPYTPPAYGGQTGGQTSGGQSGGQTSPTYGGQTGPVGGTPPPAGGTDTAQALYKAGTDAFSQGRYNDAIVSFKDFVATFPKHNLTSNAHFWEGECYFQLKDYARAALAYQEVIANFSGSNKTQDAMYKQGVALYHAGKKDAAKQRLNELIQKYPNSSQATSAKAFMQKNK